MPAPDPLEVVEEGVPILVRLGDGLSTGLFLDHRSTRRRIREIASGRSVANLFAYTCAFTVCAACGGASRTVSVDASAAALERGRANLERARVFGTGKHILVVSDVFAWLARAQSCGERFDVVVLDPPSYSSTKRARFVAEDDYAKLAAAALLVVADGGVLLACTNHRKISRARFRRMLFDGGRLANRRLEQAKDLAASIDYPSFGEPHTKTVLLTVGGAQDTDAPPAIAGRSRRTPPRGRSPQPRRHRIARRRATGRARRRSGRRIRACRRPADGR